VKKRTRPYKVVFKDRLGRIRVSSFETREARELWLARQLAQERGFVTGWTEESPPASELTVHWDQHGQQHDGYALDCPVCSPASASGGGNTPDTSGGRPGSVTPGSPEAEESAPASRQDSA
jgi:hypothetical protein